MNITAIKKTRQWKSYLTKALHIATEVLPKIPRRRDPLLNKVVSLIAIGDSIRKACIPERKRSPLRSMVDDMGLLESNNEQFVRLFFETELFKRFEVTKFSISEHTDVHIMENAELGILMFIEYAYGKNGPENIFYHSPDVDFAKILRGVWDIYNNRIHLTVGNAENGYLQSEFTTFGEIKNPLYGSSAKQIDDMVDRHHRFTDNNIPRSYMFYGDPGTGKSSAAMVFAGRLGKRILKVDSNSLANAHVKTLSFLIEYLHPDFLIIDDVDKMDMTKGLPTLLDILQRFKTEHSFVSIIMTANSVSLFDKGFLRPGRIDTWIEFKIPNDEERAAILTSYIKEEGITVSDEMIKDITTITSGLAQDYLREIVTCLKHDDGADIMKSIELMKSLLEVKGSEKPACASTNTSPQPDLLCCTKS